MMKITQPLIFNFKDNNIYTMERAASGRLSPGLHGKSFPLVGYSLGIIVHFYTNLKGPPN